MTALAKIQQAGFEVAIDGGRLKVVGASKLTTEQRSFLKTHRDELLKELRGDDQPATANDAKPTHINVCCADCLNSVLPPQTEERYGWRSCGLGLADGGGFGRVERRCTSFVSNPSMEPEALEERAAILQYDAGLTRQQADRATELMKCGWALWNAVARAKSDFREQVTIVAPLHSVEAVTTTLPTRAIAAPPLPPADLEAIHIVWTIHYSDGTRGTVRDNEGGMNYADALQYATTRMTGVIGVSHC